MNTSLLFVLKSCINFLVEFWATKIISMFNNPGWKTKLNFGFLAKLTHSALGNWKIYQKGYFGVSVILEFIN